MKKEVLLNSIGILFLLIGVLAIFDSVYQNKTLGVNLAPILWFCYSCMIILGIGVLRKDSFLVISQINILAIPLLFWNVDFFYQLFSGHTLLGIADYFFLPGPFISKLVSSQHLFSIPLGLIVLFLLNFSRKDSWQLSWIQLSVMFFITRIATNPIENVNCVYYSCTPFNFGFWYPLQWFVVTFLMAFITNFIVAKLFANKFKG